VTAHNEERNIRKLLRSLLGQKVEPHVLSEVVVVASGCTDGTHAEVQDLAKDDARLRLIIQDARLGKASAINAYGRERDRTVDAVAVVSADLILQPGCLVLLLDRLASAPDVGMVGPRPVPTNPRGRLMGNMVGFLWQLHHNIASESPKLGEVVVLRSSLLRPIPENSAVDEATLEAGVVEQGRSLSYVPEAVVANRGPDNLHEYFDQRRRIAAGHFWLRRRTGYSVPTLDVKRIPDVRRSQDRRVLRRRRRCRRGGPRLGLFRLQARIQSRHLEGRVLYPGCDACRRGSAARDEQG
jgi:cellulose synthase/poly-beta-1,6-N-acetylglucosamine synthase-like glycosyltransferase